MRLEIQQLESSIQSSKDELERMEKQLSNKEKSALLHQVNKFFGQEVPEEYLPKIKECFSNLDQSKDLKLKLFEEQKKLNQVEYQHSQVELKLKQ